MFKNYLKIAFRNIIRHKGYFFINIAGLAIGMACCIIILLWNQDEISYDNFHKKSKNLYRVVEELCFSGKKCFLYARTPRPLAPALKSEFPEIKNITRFLPGGEILVAHENKRFYEKGVAMVDPIFLRMFSFRLVRGNDKTALSDPSSILITERMATKYFSNIDPIGRILKFDNREEYKVTGIIKDIPANSHLKFDFLIPFMRSRRIGIPETQVIHYFTYVLLEENIDIKAFKQKLLNSFKKIFPSTPAKTKLFLQPLERIHLYSNFEGDLPGHGDIRYVYIFSIIAVFVLMIACINYMNLATARSANRSKEVGMRKVVGAKKRNIITQFYIESIGFSIIAIVLSLIIVELLLPSFNKLTSKEIGIGIGNLTIVIGLFALSLITGIISGSYPALILSSFQPAIVIKGGLSSIPKKISFRKWMVVFQFCLSTVLLISTIVISNQLDFMQNKKLGFDVDHQIYLPIRGDLRNEYEVFKQELLKFPRIKNVTSVSELPSFISRCSDYIDWEGKNSDDLILMKILNVDYSGLGTLKLEMVKGRYFSKSYPTDLTQGYILNETAVQSMGLKSPIGKSFSLYNRKGRIIGIVKDFHFNSFHKKIEPLILRIVPTGINFIIVKINPKKLADTLKYMQISWDRLDTGFPLEYHFLEKNIENFYKSENNIATIFNYFTFLAIFLACLGLFGLASFMAEQRTKELSVRRVLGATVSNNILLLSKEFTKWVIMANIIAWPVAYIVMSKWLQNFAYRTAIGIGNFILSAGIALMIAVLTVSYQSIKAATANPVEALRNE